MSLIEDRLLADSTEVESVPNWDDVVSRADQRATRSRRLSRSLAAGFVMLLVGIAVTQGDVSLETAPGPTAVAPDDTANIAPWSETSPVTIILRALLVWGSSALVGFVTFFASPADVRAPFIIPRISRLSASAIHIALWNALLLATTGLFMLISDSTFVDAIHGHAAFVEMVSVVTLALLLSVHVRGTMSSIWYFAALSIATSLAFQGMAWSGGSRPNTPQTVSLLSVHVLIAFLIGWIPWYVRRSLGWRRDPTRSPRSVARISGRHPGALLFVAGMIVTAVAITPALVLHTQLSDLASDLAGVDGRSWSSQHPLFAQDAPESTMDTWTAVTTSFEDGAMSELDLEAERRQLQEVLEPLGFESSVFVDPSEIPSQSSEGSVVVPSGAQPVLDRLKQNAYTARRPRGDSFEATVVNMRGGPQALQFSVENSDAFVMQRSWRNLGLAMMVTGVVLLWSSTAISRYMSGRHKWERQTRAMEIAGWAVVWSTVTALLVAGAGRLFTPEMDEVSRNFWGLLVPAGFAIWFGMWLLTPKPPSGKPQQPGP